MITDSKEYLELLYRISENNAPSIAVLAPAYEPFIEVDWGTRTIHAPDYISIKSDHRSETVFFKMDRYYDMIDLAAKFGHDSIEGYSMFEFKTPDFEKAKQIREYADSKNVKFCCISVGVDFSKIDYDEGVAILKDYAKIAQIIGSPYLHHTVIAEFRNPERVLCKKDEFLLSK
jgi:hypothetical protein